ncbi:unnamed protein product [Schistosoma rodhaini]|uniref:Uncharacterized protein n=1 Tax=Schistosoma rodhaini TaxID=6188 RepID=A0AA85G2J6_9TREM|nr:unnamed protein product [Schistosoma rodhaini]
MDLQVDNLKFISEASKNDVYGLFFLSKNKLKGYVNISSSEIYPSGCTILIESINQELRQNENNPNYSTTICHLSGATYNSTIFPLNVTILENDTETFSNVQGWNQILPSGKISKFHSSNNSINSTSSTNVQIFNSYYRSNNIARRVKRSYFLVHLFNSPRNIMILGRSCKHTCTTHN